MRTGIRKRCAYAALLYMGMNLLLFAGCKEKAVDYSMEGATEYTQERNGGNDTVSRGRKGLKQFAGESDWNSCDDDDNGWTGENAKGEKISIGVWDADVTVPDAEEMYVVEVKEPEFDAAYKKQFAERIFGDAEIYYNDLSHLPRKDIEERRKDCQNLYLLAKEGKIDYDNVIKFRTRH